MGIKVALEHRTSYTFDRLVEVHPHVVRLRPAPHSRTPIEAYSLEVEPADHFVNWQQDAFGNFLARLVFPSRTRNLTIKVGLIADMKVINPFDFFIEDYAETFPFSYPKALREDLEPYLRPVDEGEEGSGPGELVTSWLRNFTVTPGTRTIDFLVALNHAVNADVGYSLRMEPGVQTPDFTLQTGIGSCRDSAWLLVSILRQLGLAARFVSGYLVQLTSDVEALDGPSGPPADFTDLHAWTEVYIPGAGWIGLDATSGLFAGEGHIPLAATPHPSSAAPITGTTGIAETTLDFSNTVTRVHEDPRVTLPYTDAAWAAIVDLGTRVDHRLAAADVRLTIGGEPTFVSIDNQVDEEWTTAADGPHKRERASALAARLKSVWAPRGLVQRNQGKWYPGEPLPRWALNCYWREDGRAIWRKPELLADPSRGGSANDASAQRFITRLARELGIAAAHAQAGYEDGWYYLWKEGVLPENVDVLDSKLKSKLERERLRRVFEQGLDKVVGYTLPLGWDPVKERWVSNAWKFRRGHMFLLPGDSPMGLRLPLDSLLWEPEGERQPLTPRDPFAARDAIPEEFGEVHARYLTYVEPAPERFGIHEQAAADEHTEQQGFFVRTAICAEPRDGVLHLFLPPLTHLSHWLALIAAIEATASDLGQEIVLEGYQAPEDERLRRFSVTPDPGVIEVNVQPESSWEGLVRLSGELYEEARLARLGTEKFMLDGRHTGTGGGNHVTLGGKSPADSPVLRRPQLLGSLVRYWQNHPSLSYLFSGLFIGSTSQAPRVDEARDESLYELEIALQQLPQGDALSPWLVDRVMRNLLVDITGNTHRAEFCIDKLYSPDSSSGRRGLVEFRGFEMPPHERMSLVQMLLLRSLIVHFWEHPYVQKPVRWGTELHDRFMLPHYVERDLVDVSSDLKRWGYAFDKRWFDPFIEFRFPRYGTINIDDIELELRFAIEPWNVLGEEVTAQGTARFVDSSVERLQVKVRGLTDSRHLVTCNGRRLPLRNTGVRGDFVAGVRFKAWQLPSGLHPNITPQAPLVFDIVDTWNGHSLGGCTYHVEHPGGRNPETFPVNAYEAESRRLARFWQHGHTPGPVDPPAEEPNADCPFTLDMRRGTK